MTILQSLGSLIAPRDASRAQTPVEHAIARADVARDRGEWQLAAQEYRKALDDDATLDDIWVQLGHACKEAGDPGRAIHAYQQAILRNPRDPERHVHLAHLLKNQGRSNQALDHFLEAIHQGECRPSEERELLALMQWKVGKGEHAELQAMVAKLDAVPSAVAPTPFLTRLRASLSAANESSPESSAGDDDGQATMVFDISDLISFWRSARLPTGIQRVQIEAIDAALAEDDGTPIRLCCFTDYRDDWLEVPVSAFRELADLATAGGDLEGEDWREALSALDLHLSLKPSFEFPFGAMLINLGTSWWLQNYFLYVRQAKTERGIRYIPFVHDMIPIMTPEHCTHELTQDFISWALGVFEYADHYLVNSESTKKDLQEVAQILGHEVKDSDVAVIRLDSDFRKPGLEQLPEQALEDWDLAPNGFVLFVSTIESRKGHLDAFEAWSALIERHGADAVPQLVCVGNRGWLNDRVYERLTMDSALAQKVTLLSRLSDAELALLYRSCCFTIYPSLYEGWGLPVTESLCYGKVPLISRAASLPEAGGPFAVYVDPASPEQLAEAAERLMLDDAYRAALEDRIASDFAPRRWSDLARQIVAELGKFAVADAQSGSVEALPTPPAHIGCWHPLVRNTSTRIWRAMNSTEKYRSSLGWFWPEARGTRIRRSTGELRFRLAGAHPPLRLMIALRGDENERCRYAIACAEEELNGELELDATRWVWFDLPGAAAAHDCTVIFSALPAPDGGLPTYFVSGFHLRDLADEKAREDFLEAVTLRRLDVLDAFGERRQQAN